MRQGSPDQNTGSVMMARGSENDCADLGAVRVPEERNGDRQCEEKPDAADEGDA